ncbi:hypothetical protein [Cryptosporangium sp. NPDC048952]|uniref:hypothetical protein n=1 Tax=Cryptosporangium sp. NPDC048952 TaxID=3363961 RepID=UPI00371B8829
MVAGGEGAEELGSGGVERADVAGDELTVVDLSVGADQFVQPCSGVVFQATAIRRDS